ncbi:hypothetical protein AOQ84DRAFT_417129 [Glonium stellatum]|uniref:Ribosomal protein L9 domain-containing protein n=1 Tax=Glonium stellatum TaxID=574774 RepID=A0A8E2FAW3_9PEZI|nr:hypothetical protein AOQ84DRAFT_417129 [Glonium stellatum]
MATLARSSLLPQCTSCARRYARLAFEGWRPLQQSQQQIRGKQKLAKPADTVTIKLLKDVRRFGRKGSCIPISAGQMRNRWYPSRIAEYVSANELKELKRQNVDIERDFTFGVEIPAQEIVDTEEEQIKPYVRPIELEFLSPERSTELISIFVPQTIEFFRQPIESDTKESLEQHLGASDAADILRAAATSTPKPELTSIYGSVSTADVLTSIKAVLANNDEAARVILSESDIRFVEGLAAGETTRVKHLGRFAIEIQVKGVNAPIKRTVSVRAQR